VHLVLNKCGLKYSFSNNSFLRPTMFTFRSVGPCLQSSLSARGEISSSGNMERVPVETWISYGLYSDAKISVNMGPMRQWVHSSVW
jgi:hypothetical protein